ncbi:ComEA family DNA-binding protein [Actimicrobium antarcticum]|uniref:Helix-hairpin-helix domain-containing protein n=1 Tax=Actimicrobium antarcticum TaxID=1051899 RepID=A0ABP7TDT1_9BURK
MFKKIVLAVAGLVASIGIALAQTPVEINKADQAALDGIRGIGPKLSRTILDERKKGGPFKGWPDLENRVNGIKIKSAMRLSDAGLTVDGQPRQSSVAGNGKVAASAAGRAGEVPGERDTGPKK